MFCSTCGNQVNPGLRFCNSCGARLRGSDSLERADSSSLPSVNLLLSFTLALPLAGLAILLALLIVMKKALDFRDEMVIGIAIMTFVLLLVSEMGLIGMLWSRMRAARRSTEFPEEEAPRQFPAVVMKGLNEGRPDTARDLVPSVTEHTTRTLDPVPRDPQKS